VAWSADGKAVATSCADNLIRVFDMSDIRSRDPKFKRIRTDWNPLAVGFGDTPDQMVAVLKGKRRRRPLAARAAAAALVAGPSGPASSSDAWRAHVCGGCSRRRRAGAAAPLARPLS
jgi:hypothetical protein